MEAPRRSRHSRVTARGHGLSPMCTSRTTWAGSGQFVFAHAPQDPALYRTAVIAFLSCAITPHGNRNASIEEREKLQVTTLPSRGQCAYAACLTEVRICAPVGPWLLLRLTLRFQLKWDDPKLCSCFLEGACPYQLFEARLRKSRCDQRRDVPTHWSAGHAEGHWQVSVHS